MRTRQLASEMIFRSAIVASLFAFVATSCAPAALKSDFRSIEVALDLTETTQSMNSLLALTDGSEEIMLPLHAAIEIRAGDKTFFRGTVANNQEIELDLPFGDVEVRSIFLAETRPADWKDYCSAKDGENGTASGQTALTDPSNSQTSSSSGTTSESSQGDGSSSSGDHEGGGRGDLLYVAANRQLISVNSETAVLGVSFGPLGPVGFRRLNAQMPSQWSQGQAIIYSDPFTNSPILEPCTGQPIDVSHDVNDGLVRLFLPKAENSALADFAGRPLSPAQLTNVASPARWIDIDSQILGLQAYYPVAKSAAESTSTVDSSNAREAERRSTMPVRIDTSVNPSKVMPLVLTADADGDGINNGAEIASGSNPFRKMKAISLTSSVLPQGFGIEAQILGEGGTSFWSSFREARCKATFDLSRLSSADLKRLEDFRSQLRASGSIDNRFVADLSKPLELQCGDRFSLYGIAGRVTLDVLAFDFEGYRDGTARATIDVPAVSFGISVAPSFIFQEDQGPYLVNFRIDGARVGDLCSQIASASPLQNSPFSSLQIRGSIPNCQVEMITPPNAHGAASMRIAAASGVARAEAMFNIEIRAVSDRPMWVDSVGTGTFVVPKNSSVGISLRRAFDPDVGSAGENLNYVFLHPANGQLSSLSANPSVGGNILIYTPNANFAGTDTFRYSACDSSGNLTHCTPEQFVSVNVTNSAPGMPTLSGTSVNENSPFGTVVGVLSASDNDINEALSFSLVSGSGDAGNALFRIVGGGILEVIGSLDSETDPAISIRVRVTDSSGLYAESPLSITIQNVNELPLIEPVPNQEATSSTFSLTVEVIDADNDVNCSSASLTRMSGADLLLGGLTSSGAGEFCTLTVSLRPNTYGLATMSVAVSDFAGNTTATNFQLAAWPPGGASALNLSGGTQSKGFTDPATGAMWTALQRGAGIDFRYSDDAGMSWSFAGGLETLSSDFSVIIHDGQILIAFTDFPSKRTVKVAKGSIVYNMDGSQSISFSVPENAFNEVFGTRYRAPVLAIDDAHQLWIGAVQTNSMIEKVALVRSQGDALANALNTWNSVTSLSMGEGLQSISLLATVGESLLLFANGRALSAMTFDGSTWSPISASGMSFYSHVADSVSAPARGLEAGAVVKSAVVYDGELYVGGNFRIEGTHVTNVARWTGRSWVAVGAGFDNTVYALHVGEDGALYAGGMFRRSGSQQVGAVAKWNGLIWEPIASGQSFFTVGGGEVFALASKMNGPIFSLYAAGSLTSGVAQMESGAWSFLPSAGNPVNDLTIDGSGLLYAGLSTGVKFWNGSSWLNLPGASFNAAVHSMLFDKNVGTQGSIYIGGSFTSPQQRIVRYDVGTAQFSPLSSGLPNSVYSLGKDSSGKIIAGTTSGGANGAISLFDGTSWQSRGSALDGPPLALVDFQDIGLVVGGDFGRTISYGFSPVQKVLVSSLSPVGTQPGGISSANPSLSKVKTVALSPDGTRSCIGGSFSKIGTVAANNVACWTGTAWQSLGTGLNGGDVEDLLFTPSGRLFAAGAFTSPPGYFAEFNFTSSTWATVGVGTGGPVHELELISENQGVSPTVPRIALGGSFTILGNSVAASRIAIWNGAAFEASFGGPNGVVESLAYDSVRDRLYVGGSFTMASAITANNVAYYYLDSASAGTPAPGWSALNDGSYGQGLNGPVYAMAQLGDSLYIGGAFTQVGITPTGFLVKWYTPDPNTPSWFPQTTGFDQPVRSLHFAAGTLHAAGDFQLSNGGHVRGFAANQMGVWHAAGGGLIKPSALASRPGGPLFAGTFGGLFEAKPVIAAGLGSFAAAMDIPGAALEVVVAGQGHGGEVVVRGFRDGVFGEPTLFVPPGSNRAGSVSVLSEGWGGPFHVLYTRVSNIQRNSYTLDANRDLIAAAQNVIESPVVSGLFSIGEPMGQFHAPLLTLVPVGDFVQVSQYNMPP